MTAKAEKKQGKHLFQPGKSGNPAGRAQGSRNKATIAAQNLLDGEGNALTRKAFEKALEGDMTALKLCLERLVPVRKSAPVKIDLPNFTSIGDLPTVTQAITEATSSGTLTTDEAEKMMKVFDRHMKALELTEIEERVRALEAAGK